MRSRLRLSGGAAFFVLCARPTIYPKGRRRRVGRSLSACVNLWLPVLALGLARLPCGRLAAAVPCLRSPCCPALSAGPLCGPLTGARRSGMGDSGGTA